jgi:hypothetical protein
MFKRSIQSNNARSIILSPCCCCCKPEWGRITMTLRHCLASSLPACLPACPSLSLSLYGSPPFSNSPFLTPPFFFFFQTELLAVHAARNNFPIVVKLSASWCFHLISHSNGLLARSYSCLAPHTGLSDRRDLFC